MVNGEYRLCAVVGIAAKMRSAPFEVLHFDIETKEVVIFDKDQDQYLSLDPVRFVQRYHGFFCQVLNVRRVPILIGCLQDDIVIYASRPVPGRRSEELVGLPWDAVFVDEQAYQVAEALDLAREQGAAVFVGDGTDPSRVLAVPVKNLVIQVPADARALTLLAVAEESPAQLRGYVGLMGAANDD